MVSLEGIINNYSEEHKELVDNEVDEYQMYYLSEAVIEYIRDDNDINYNIISNIHAFIQNHLDRALKVAIYKALANLDVTYTAKDGKQFETQFMDPYLDLFPDANDTIAILMMESEGKKLIDGKD